MGVAGYFDFAPLVGDVAVGIEYEGAAFDAEGFFAVEFFEFDDVEQAADGFVGIAEQQEVEALFLAEVLMGFDAVAGDADDGVAQFGKLGQQAVEVEAFGGAAGGVVFGIEIDDEGAVVAAVEGFAVAGGEGEVVGHVFSFAWVLGGFSVYGKMAVYACLCAGERGC